jgi:hypothetical protein
MVVKMDNKQSQDTQAEKTSPAVSTDGRRKFLRKATAGALIATIPAKSVWATGLTSSVVASGHGSDMAGGQTLVVKGPNYWANRSNMIDQSVLSQTFAGLFGGPALKGNGDHLPSDLTIGEILLEKNGNDNYVYNGPSRYNRLMVSTYLSALYSDSAMFDVHFPVIGHGRAYPSHDIFAQKLYLMGSSTTASSFANELNTLRTNPTSLAGI